MNFQRLLPLILLGLLFFGGCKNSGNKRGPYQGADVGDSSQQRGQITVTPGSAAGFLATGYEPLEQWMDERFRVRYENMPLNMVFEQKPISDIRYQLQNVPGNAPLFYLVTPSISRRELLKEISKFYNLSMRVEMVNGEPSYVVVTGRGSASSSGPVRPVSGIAQSEVSAPASRYGQEQVLGTVPRAQPAVEQGNAVPLRESSPVEVANRGEVSVESVYSPSF